MLLWTSPVHSHCTELHQSLLASKPNLSFFSELERVCYSLRGFQGNNSGVNQTAQCKTAPIWEVIFSASGSLTDLGAQKQHLNRKRSMCDGLLSTCTRVSRLFPVCTFLISLWLMAPQELMHNRQVFRETAKALLQETEDGVSNLRQMDVRQQRVDPPFSCWYLIRRCGPVLHKDNMPHSIALEFFCALRPCVTCGESCSEPQKEQQ